MKKSKVVLFYPTYKGIGQWNWMPFPFLYLAPYLERAGYEVLVIDARIDDAWRDTLRAELADALFLGITAMTGPDLRTATEAADLCKEHYPALPVLWGGPHASAIPEVTVDRDDVDVVVIGQGEEIMVELADRIAAGRDYRDVKGIAYMQDGKMIKTPAAPTVKFDHDLFPAYHLMDIEKYRSPNNVVSLFSALGCPFSCSFCTTGEKHFLARTNEQAKREIDYLTQDLGFDNLFFQDGTFFLKKERVLDLAQHMKDLGPNVRWKAKARASSLLDYTPDELALLRDSGLVSVFFGLESGSKKILGLMNKGIDTEMCEKSAAICRDYNFEFYTSFMFAVPYEGLADLKDSIKLIHRLEEINPEVIVQNAIYIPLPGTPMYDMAIECGYIPPSTLEEWSERSINCRFEERVDVNWLPEDEAAEYIALYNKEFGYVKGLFEKEQDGEYESVFKKRSGADGIGTDGLQTDE